MQVVIKLVRIRLVPVHIGADVHSHRHVRSPVSPIKVHVYLPQDKAHGVCGKVQVQHGVTVSQSHGEKGTYHPRYRTIVKV